MFLVEHGTLIYKITSICINLSCNLLRMGPDGSRWRGPRGDCGPAIHPAADAAAAGLLRCTPIAEDFEGELAKKASGPAAAPEGRGRVRLPAGPPFEG